VWLILSKPRRRIEKGSPASILHSLTSFHLRDDFRIRAGQPLRIEPEITTKRTEVLSLYVNHMKSKKRGRNNFVSERGESRINPNIELGSPEVQNWLMGSYLSMKVPERWFEILSRADDRQFAHGAPKTPHRQNRQQSRITHDYRAPLLKFSKTARKKS